MPIALAERISLLFPAKIFLRRTHLDFALEDFFFSKQPTDFGGQTSKRDTTILLPRGKLRKNWEGKHTFTHAHCCSWGGKKSFSSFSTPFCYPCTGKIVKYSPQYTLFHKKNQENPKQSRDDHRTRPNLGPGSSAPGECSEPIDGGGPPDDNPLPRPDGQRARSPSPCPERHSASTGFRNRPPGRGPGRAHARW